MQVGAHPKATFDLTFANQQIATLRKKFWERVLEEASSSLLSTSSAIERFRESEKQLHECIRIAHVHLILHGSIDWNCLELSQAIGIQHNDEHGHHDNAPIPAAQQSSLDQAEQDADAEPLSLADAEHDEQAQTMKRSLDDAHAHTSTQAASLKKSKHQNAPITAAQHSSLATAELDVQAQSRTGSLDDAHAHTSTAYASGVKQYLQLRLLSRAKIWASFEMVKP